MWKFGAVVGYERVPMEAVDEVEDLCTGAGARVCVLCGCVRGCVCVGGGSYLYA